MASYLVEVAYKDNGVAKKVRIGIDDVFPDMLSHAVDMVVNYRTAKGETPTEVSATLLGAQ